MSWGKNIKLSLFGESHGTGIGVVIEGLPHGLELDTVKIQYAMDRRAPGRTQTSTARVEPDKPRFISGVYRNKTTGSPLCAIIDNKSQRSEDYNLTLPRPGHADLAANRKYGGFSDMRGGGHFSGRLTAPIVLAGYFAEQILNAYGVTVIAHVASIGGIEDACIDGFLGYNREFWENIQDMPIPALLPEKSLQMSNRILEAKERGDSLGGIIEACALGITLPWGEPFFESVESVLAGLFFSIPAVKGVEFGDGFKLALMSGSEVKDELTVSENRQIKTLTNHNGGINGGICNGMPLLARVAIKPTPSISLPQQTVNLDTMEVSKLQISGRHDPCIVPRAVAVVRAAMALGLADLALDNNKRKGC